MFPNYNQWKKWSLPAKLSVISAYLTIIGFVGSLFFSSGSDSTEPKPNIIIIDNFVAKSGVIDAPQIANKSETSLSRSEPRPAVKSENQFIDEIRNKLGQNRNRIPEHSIREAERLIAVRRIEEASVLVDREIAIAEEREQVITRCENYKKIDTDGDGISDIDECKAGLSPLYRDSDGDGYDDDIEITHRSDPKDKYSYPRISIAQVEVSNRPSSQNSNSSRINSVDQFSENNRPASSEPAAVSSQQGMPRAGGGSFDFYIISLLFFIQLIRWTKNRTP